MKLSKLALAAMLACGSFASHALADQGNEINLVSHCDCGQPVCGCETITNCDAGCCDSGGCDSCCDSGCGLGLGSRLGDLIGLGDCCLGDPYTLFGEHCGWSAGGWVQLGYHSEANTLFNSRPDEYQLHQAWLWAEKAIDTSCGFDIGGRIDYIYGTDGPDTQASGTDPRGWDNSWDNGGDDGHALPQLYLEAGYGDLSVKIGHFYTIIGYEVVGAPGNFFYSHAYTF
ncbi:MAG: porin, partial [Pirellulales bacterium]|nr:porin [Pirellulales bacterium]